MVFWALVECKSRGAYFLGLVLTMQLDFEQILLSQGHCCPNHFWVHESGSSAPWTWALGRYGIGWFCDSFKKQNGH